MTRPVGKRVGVALLAASTLMMLARPAAAEWFTDLYAGAVITDNHNVVENTSNGSASVTKTFLQVHFDGTANFGTRFGYWFDALPWIGMGIDIFEFEPDIPQQARTSTVNNNSAPDTFAELDVSVTALAFDVLWLRAPLLASPEFPHGRLQPFLAAGPALFITDVANRGHFHLIDVPTDSDTVFGAKVSAGLIWKVTPKIGLFGEYRFTRFSPHVNVPPSSTAASTPLTTTLASHHVLAGLSLTY